MGRKLEDDGSNVNLQIITNTRNAAGIAWSLWAVSLALVAAAHAIAFASRAPLYEYWVESTLLTPTFATLGALIVSRRPGNIIGWLFLVPPVAGGMQFLSGQYATTALSDSTNLSGGAYAAWLSTMMQSSFVFTAIFLIMLFPTGGLPSPRWRMVAWATGAVMTISLVSLALRPGPFDDFSARNPFGLEGAAEVVDLLQAVGGFGGIACAFAVVFSLALRFYRSTGEERLQIKWFAYAATLGVMAILFGSVLVPASFDEKFGTLVWTIAPLGLPVSAAIAVLKYHLYDIDLIIRKTAIYGALTLSLLAVYFTGVAGGTRLLSPLVGEGNQLAVVASTLAIAALFAPFRRRIQNFIDHRFYRRKYDAQKTLEAFSSKLRDETDLDALGADLVSVVHETVRPSHASLWLREPKKPDADRR